MAVHAGTDMAGATPNPLLTPFDRKKAAAVGLRRWVRFESNGTTDILQVCCCYLETHHSAPSLDRWPWLLAQLVLDSARLSFGRCMMAPGGPPPGKLAGS